MSGDDRVPWLVVDGDSCSVRIDDGTLVPEEPSLDTVPCRACFFSFVATVYEGDYVLLVDKAFCVFLDKIDRVLRFVPRGMSVTIDLPDKMDPTRDYIRPALEHMMTRPVVHVRIAGTNVTPLVQCLPPPQARGRLAILVIVERASDVTSSAVLPVLKELLNPNRSGFIIYEMRHSTVVFAPHDTRKLLSKVEQMRGQRWLNADQYYDAVRKRSAALLIRADDGSPSVVFKGDERMLQGKKAATLLFWINNNNGATLLVPMLQQFRDQYQDAHLWDPCRTLL